MQDQKSIEQQIKLCQERITRLEEYKRGSWENRERIEKDLDRAYQQIALLKIRQMMNF